MEVLQNKKNNLLHREEVLISLDANVTPSKLIIVEDVSKHMKKPVGNIVIEKIDGRFGTKNVLVYAKIYDDEKSRHKFEVVSRKLKKKLVEEAKKATEAAASAVVAEGEQ